MIRAVHIMFVNIEEHLCVLGMGPMPWTVNSEIYPLWARSTGNACSAGVNWIFNVLVSLTFLHVAEFLTYYGKTPSGGLMMVNTSILYTYYKLLIHVR